MIGESDARRRLEDKSNQDMQSQDEEGEEEMEQQFNEEDESQDNEEDDATHNDEPKRVRELLATIRVPYKGPNESIIFSYHYKYEKYLRDHNLIDPEKAKEQQERMRRKLQLRNEKAKTEQKEQPQKDGQAKEAAGGAGAAPALNALDGEDLSGMDDDGSYPGAMNGKYRFDQLIKTMIARIEYNNTLAPV